MECGVRWPQLSVIEGARLRVQEDYFEAALAAVEVVLTPDSEDTIVVLTQRGVPPTHISDHCAGWERQLGRLSAVVR